MERLSFEKIATEHFAFWNDLSESDKDLLSQAATIGVYDKNQNIHSGKKCTGTLIVLTGNLRTYILSEEDRQITLFRQGKGDVCVLSASCALSSLSFDVFIDAEEKSTLCIIDGKAFAKVQESNLSMKNFVLEKVVSRFDDVMWVLQQIVFMSFDKRLAIFLWDEVCRNASTSLFLTHEEIAHHTGTAREVVSRMLKYFSDEKIVQLSRKKIEVRDKNKLRMLAM